MTIHLIFEYIAFFLAYRYYAYLRKGQTDAISSLNRLSIIIGAAFGALLGSRVIGLLENPNLIPHMNIVELFNHKTIMGGLFGGLLGVELAKKIIGEKHSSGDLFTFPIIVGIIIGRIGCFLMGTEEFTYGKKTAFFTGMDLGDGVLRHPLALYEIVFLVVLIILLKRFQKKYTYESGTLFKLFMLSYFGFRFFIEFLKPNVYFTFGLSTIQILCVTCWLYYLCFIVNFKKIAIAS